MPWEYHKRQFYSNPIFIKVATRLSWVKIKTQTIEWVCVCTRCMYTSRRARKFNFSWLTRGLSRVKTDKKILLEKYWVNLSLGMDFYGFFNDYWELKKKFPHKVYFIFIQSSVQVVDVSPITRPQHLVLFALFHVCI